AGDGVLDVAELLQLLDVLDLIEDLLFVAFDRLGPLRELARVHCDQIAVENRIVDHVPEAEDAERASGEKCAKHGDGDFTFHWLGPPSLMRMYSIEPSTRTPLTMRGGAAIGRYTA